jgi:hypothetical protein
MINADEVRTIVFNLDQQVGKASSLFDKWVESNDPWDEPSWLIEACFLQLLAASEALGLAQFRSLVNTEYLRIKGSSAGFPEVDLNPGEEPYSPVLGIIRKFLLALKAFLPSDSHTTVTKDLLEIIRNVHYVITDKTVFPDVPKDEKDVHLRIGAILKCVFPDLKHKPTLSKQIKNFEPDAGIPSLRTLIEYKYLSRSQDVGVIADQLLADTRGYTSRDWERFLYVIYETNRFKTENDWNQLMRDSGVPTNTTVVVLSGEPRPLKRAATKNAYPKNSGKRSGKA